MPGQSAHRVGGAGPSPVPPSRCPGRGSPAWGGSSRACLSPSLTHRAASLAGASRGRNWPPRISHSGVCLPAQAQRQEPCPVRGWDARSVCSQNWTHHAAHSGLSVQKPWWPRPLSRPCLPGAGVSSSSAPPVPVSLSFQTWSGDTGRSLNLFNPLCTAPPRGPRAEPGTW